MFPSQAFALSPRYTHAFGSHEEPLLDDPELELEDPPLLDEPPLVVPPPLLDVLPPPPPELPLGPPDEHDTGSQSAGTAGGVHPASLVWAWMHW